MAVRIYFCGEVVADFHEAAEGSGEFKLSLGGSLFHGATGAQRAVDREKLNFKIGFVGPLSTDMLGERFFKVLTDMHIDTRCVKRVDRNTTLALVSIRPDHENGFVFYSKAGADEMTTIDDLPVDVGDKGDKKIFCCGSISTVIEPARHAWLAFARHQSKSSLFFYDLNTRPDIARDRETYRGIVYQWAQTAHIIRASDADIGWAYPGKTIREVADIWLSAGAHLAVVTKSTRGSEAYTREAGAQVSSVDLKAANTIGAGDNFNAGFALSLAKMGCFTPEDVKKLSQDNLMTILRGGNENAADHLRHINLARKHG